MSSINRTFLSKKKIAKAEKSYCKGTPGVSNFISPTSVTIYFLDGYPQSELQNYLTVLIFGQFKLLNDFPTIFGSCNRISRRSSSYAYISFSWNTLNKPLWYLSVYIKKNLSPVEYIFHGLPHRPQTKLTNQHVQFYLLPCYAIILREAHDDFQHFPCSSYTLMGQ